MATATEVASVLPLLVKKLGVEFLPQANDPILSIIFGHRRLETVEIVEYDCGLLERRGSFPSRMTSTAFSKPIKDSGVVLIG